MSGIKRARESGNLYRRANKHMKLDTMEKDAQDSSSIKTGKQVQINI